MSSHLASDMVRRIRDRLKPHCHDGIILSAEEVCALLRNLNSVMEIALNNEEELAIQERLQRLQRASNAPSQRPRPTLVVNNDGGPSCA